MGGPVRCRGTLEGEGSDWDLGAIMLPNSYSPWITDTGLVAFQPEGLNVLVGDPTEQRTTSLPQAPSFVSTAVGNRHHDRLLLADTGTLWLYDSGGRLMRRVHGINGWNAAGWSEDGSLALLVVQKDVGGSVWCYSFRWDSGQPVGEIDLLSLDPLIRTTVTTMPAAAHIVNRKGARYMDAPAWTRRISAIIPPGGGPVWIGIRVPTTETQTIEGEAFTVFDDVWFTLVVEVDERNNPTGG
jgi:hypothetical protein